MRSILTTAAVAVAVTTALAVPADAAAKTWKVTTSPPHAADGQMNGVVALGSQNGWAFGGTGVSTMKPLAYHWNGKTWKSVTLPSLHGWLWTGSATSTSNVWAINSPGEVGSGTEAVLHWNGTKWSVSKKGFAGHPSGVTAISRTNVWLFGAPGADAGSGTWHYNGTKWTRLSPPFYPSMASAVSAKNIWAIGRSKSGNSRTVGHYNGTKWTTTSLSGVLPSGEVFLKSVRASSATSVWVAGFKGTVPLLAHWNGSAWHRVSVPGSGQLSDITPDGHGGLWFTRSSTAADYTTTATVIHRSSSGTWSTAAVSGLGTDNLRQVGQLALIPGTTSLWGAGSLGKAGVNPTGVVLSYS